jgi:hypothetical protein
MHLSTSQLYLATSAAGRKYGQYNDPCVVIGVKPNIPLPKADLICLAYFPKPLFGNLLEWTEGTLIRCDLDLCLGGAISTRFLFAGRSCLPANRKDKVEMIPRVEDAKYRNCTV